MSKQKDMGFALKTAQPQTVVTNTFASVINKMKSSDAPQLAIQKLERIRELTRQSKATTFELMKNLHDIFENENLLKTMGYKKGDFGLMCDQLFGLPKEIASKYANSGAYVLEVNGAYMTPFAVVDELGFATDITPTALIEMTFPKKYNDKGITLEVFSAFWNDYIKECGKLPTTKQIRDFKRATVQLLDKNEKLLESGFAGVKALLEENTQTQTEDKKTEDKKTEDKKTEDKKTEDKKTDDKVVLTQQKTEDTTTDTEFENTIPEFELAELVEMLKDKMDEIKNTDPVQLYEMFGSDLMKIFSDAIATSVKKKTIKKRNSKKKTEEKTEPTATEPTATEPTATE